MDVLTIPPGGDEMPEEVSILEDLGIIQVDSYGRVTEGDLLVSMEEILAIQKERGLSRVFVDASRETALPSALPLHQFGSVLSQDATTLKFAVLVSDQVREDLRFLETVTQKRGMQVRMFDSRAEALAWLRE
jgi:hypothetical protein